MVDTIVRATRLKATVHHIPSHRMEETRLGNECGYAVSPYATRLVVVISSPLLCRLDPL
jgi:hypothetical protein